MSFWLLAVLFGAATVVVALAAEHRHKIWARPLASLGTLFTAGAMAWGVLFDGGQSLGEQVLQREMSYTAASTEILARHLADRYPGSHAMVIYPLRHQRDDRRLQAMLQGLERGFGNQIRIVVRHDPAEPRAYRVDDPEHDKEAYEHIALESWFNADYFDRMFTRKTHGCDLIISLAGLPGDAEKMKFWGKENRPKLALAYQGAPRLADLVKEGRITAAVTTRALPENDPKGLPADVRAAFDQRFELLTEPQKEPAQLPAAPAPMP